MKHVLVAGATGYLGGHLVTELSRRGCRVRALARRPEQADALPAADEVFVGRVTDPATLAGVADGVDTVFSALGITRPSDRSGYEQVDYGGNLALLREAERAGVDRFAYVSVLNGPAMRGRVRLAEAKERFVAELVSSSLRHTVIRPTGFFADMRAFLGMAERGRCYLVGAGQQRINPISGRDLAAACADAAFRAVEEIEVGGPDVFTHEQIARLAADAVNRPVRLTHLPPALLRTLTAALRLVSPERIYGPLQFFQAVMTADMVAPCTGGDHLADFFRQELAQRTASR